MATIARLTGPPRKIGRYAFLVALVTLELASAGGTGGIAHAGLYDSDASAIKSGPILDRDYWRAKWNSMRMDDAIKEHQPEGAILIQVIGQQQLLDDLIKKYPNDEDLKKWQTEAKDVQAKIDPDANRSDELKAGCLWSEINYREAYVNYNYAKTAMDQKNWDAAHDGIVYAQQNLEPLQQRIKDNDRVNAWPEGAAKWVTDTSAELARMDDQVKQKLK
jgi:hypothetical protein